MLTYKLSGNFGNNIAQLISTRCIAEKLGYSWGFNPHPFGDYYNGSVQTDFLEIDYGKSPENIQNVFHEKDIRYNHNGDSVDIRTFDSNVYNVSDNTELVGVFQSPGYFYARLDDIKNWIKIRPEVKTQTFDILKFNNIVLDDDTCVINFRGGEYRNYSSLLVRTKYYLDAIEEMKKINSNMKFVIITDDIQGASQNIPGIPCYHFSIAVDYTIINFSKWLILSNSSFPIFSALTNESVGKIIAPMYWARYNVSNGYWAIGDQIYPKFDYLNRDGSLQDYETVKSDAVSWRVFNNFLDS